MTLDAILDAATRVLTMESLSGFNTNRVAEVAGVSVGSLYQYFPNKAALMSALIDREQLRLATALEAAVERSVRLPLAEGLGALARLAIDQQYRDPLLAAALDHEERRLPIEARLKGHEQRLAAAIMRFLDAHRNVLPEGSVSITVARDMLLIARALVEADVGQRTPAPGLESRIVRALIGYLRA